MSNQILQKNQACITYKLVGRVDGRWTIQAFDKKGNPLGTTVMVNSVKEAWKVLFMLEGHAVEEDTVRIEEAS